MFNTRNIVTGLISAAALMAGASAHAGSMPFMPRGEGVGAPMGFAELCRRDVATCGLPSGQLALMGVDAPAGSALTSSVGAQPASPFQAAHAVSTSEEASPPPAVAPTPIALSEDAIAGQGSVNVAGSEAAATTALMTWMSRSEREQLKLLNQVNQLVNREVKKASDLDLYGQPEYWSLPRLVDGKLYGDCEDYALEKRRQLIAAGVPQSALSLAVAFTARGESHAVLMISLKSGDWVLDNLTPWATPWEDLNYRWVERQVPGTALWTSAT
ncbi:cysteine protease [Caulobacter segnis]|uniref:Transglutaminase family protein cysteine peptidase BTLCP n=2 Tax=Caulobacter segnis TaxID=88688 RepID=D5VPI4_CAUST|nr:transglutaminase-like cysteine peptidase [Caulobacter segnis]ADG12407.1 transglutaminase family protein cysteine peptidase BTLCP [Caulobacter segnis ATCC 21756]AVQ03992.1 cysteine protease [Caulobacter segnis]